VSENKEGLPVRFDRIDRRSLLRRTWVTHPATRRGIGPPLPDDAAVNLVLDLALRIGEVLMASGAGASDVTATVIAVTSACGLPHCEVDVIFTSISICCQRGSDLAPVTTHRVVRSRALDYARLSDVEHLVRRITSGRLAAQDASGRRRARSALVCTGCSCWPDSTRSAPARWPPC
jgi:hypothetical protein